MENKPIGIILKGVGGLYSVRLLSDAVLPAGSVVACRARGSFRHERLTPLPGDTVTLSCPDFPSVSEKPSPQKGEQSGFAIEEIVNRKNALIRPPLANLDYLFITMAAASPTPILTTVDKLLAIAEFNKIEPVVVITKNELAPDYAETLVALYRQCGFTCFSTSAKDDRGIEPIDRFIQESLTGKG